MYWEAHGTDSRDFALDFLTACLVLAADRFEIARNMFALFSAWKSQGLGLISHILMIIF